MQVSLIADCQNLLGEGPLWDERLGVLYWVDIRSAQLYALDFSSGRVTHRPLNAPVSAMGLTGSDLLIAAAGRQVGVLDPIAGQFAPRLEFERDLPANRSNDGAVLSDGRFWFGTMDDGGADQQGSLYALDCEWRLQRVLGDLSIPNGIVNTQDGCEVLVADSSRQMIFKHRLNGVTGALGAAHLFATTLCGPSAPDGAALDEEGCLWSACWDGGSVVRYDPTGCVAATITLPVSRPTSCAFAGAGLSTLFITSAREGLSKSELAREPLAGGLFAVDVKVRGAPSARFSL
ncbi:SMP-30/gluconolactonase/LRE family protein [Terricaulis sp.]|uniref:SMP-30/gluconolactonase/LRE family protein n=1 Tax=Terricaulis sp. TaxID=2768686 RepID=UPI002AC3CAE8|nr:SMP-30/gluconolactonase/LRE family protein [Terricaulis sp.]MDZ4690928.1 SMP-30/gluconolactonase/LRE family protein [Terricaulis sp.]